MTPTKLTDDLFVGPQITLANLSGLAEQGFRSIIVNRPDGESYDQPSFVETDTAAKPQGLKVRYIPIESGNITDADIAAFKAAMHEMPKPVFAYCRSGARSTMMWALAQDESQSADAVIATAREAGYDISGLAPRIGQQLRA
jgi:sulfide:quinone oxidoreductase